MRTTISLDELADIRDVKVDSTLSQRERVIDYRRQIKDPLHYRCGTMKVNANFATNGKGIEDCLRPCVT